jgi:hypothetical protein
MTWRYWDAGRCRVSSTSASLAARRVSVGILSQASKGRPERSARYRDVLAPPGIPRAGPGTETACTADAARLDSCWRSTCAGGGQW